jgi:hypothetical protein
MVELDLITIDAVMAHQEPARESPFRGSANVRRERPRCLHRDGVNKAEEEGVRRGALGGKFPQDFCREPERSPAADLDLRFMRSLLAAQQELNISHALTPDQGDFDPRAVSEDIGDRRHPRFREADEGYRIVLGDDHMTRIERYRLEIRPDKSKIERIKCA